ncbi:energy transducer TonB [Rheinheimera sp.]|uniref:energy transducer TonB n=1 Tax=Rheinheimera sp. TaxID=1869214 RepID=UPI00307DD988
MMSISQAKTSQQFAVAITGAAAVTFFLFVLMQTLLGQHAVPVFHINSEPVVLSLIRPDTEPEKHKAALPVFPPPVQPPVIARNIGGEGTGPELVTEPPRIEPPSFSDDPTAGLQDKAALPLVRIEPKYPVQAARDGIQGWVKLSYSIDSAGQVTNVQVLEAEPKRVFEREAIRALQQWKYQPQMTEGKAVAQHGLVVQLDFGLDAQ